MSRISRAHEELDYAEALYREMTQQVYGVSVCNADERLLGIRLARLILEQHDVWHLRGDQGERFILCDFDGEPWPCEIAAAVLDHWAPGDEP